MRRLFVLVCAPSLLALAAPATAQSPSPSEEPPLVRLELLEQTPWVGPPPTAAVGSLSQTTEAPQVEVRFLATNLAATPLHDLTIGVTLFGRLLSRTAYEQSLVADPVPAVVIEAETLAREGSIGPGESRTFEISLPMDAPGVDATSSGIYPLKVDLRSDGVPLAAIRTPVIDLVREPEQPMALSWTVVLHEPIAFRPDGVFTSTALEETLEPGGRLAAEIRALEGLIASQVAIDLAISPVLLTQLARMRDGYSIEGPDGIREVEAGRGGSAAAAEALEALRRIVDQSSVELSALPFSAPQIPSLISGGLARDLDVQLLRGREVVGTVLGRPPDATVMRPPDGALDEAALEAMDDRGVRVLALDPGTVESPLQPLGFAPPPVTAFGGSTDLVGLLPDPAVAALIASPSVMSDPVLGAQVVLGELAAIWQELPGEARGLTIVLPESLLLPGRFYAPFVSGVATAPWLRPVSGSDLAAEFPPGDPNALATPTAPSFSATYVGEIKQTRRRIDVYRSMLAQDSLGPERLDTQLLLAEAGQFLSDPTDGFAFVLAASRAVDAVFAAVRADAGPVVTLTSRSGSRIPVRVTNEGAEALQISVGLVSQYLSGSPSEDLVLAPRTAQELVFDVELKATGRFPVLIQVLAPTGRVVSESKITVRSTAYSRIALIITIVAAVVLVLVWARRLLPRRTR